MNSVRIVGRFDQFTGIGWHGWSFLKSLSETKSNLTLEAVPTTPDYAWPKISTDAFTHLHTDVKVIPFGQAKDDLADFSVFCDVLGQGDKFYHRLGRINALYFVWDSTRLPDHFVDIINSDFDLCLVPSNFVKHAMINSGVELDIIVLPLAIKEFQTPPASDNSRPVFGFVGSLEDRKNVKLLIESFNKAIGDQAKLKIHLCYSHLEDSRLDELYTIAGSNDIHITTGYLTTEPYYKFLQTVDCFISLSMGEGYSIIPREFMFLERPLILSHSSALQEIPALEGIIFLDSQVPYPAIYPQIDNQQHGIFHGPFPQDVVSALKNVMATFNKRPAYTQLSQYAHSLTPTSLGELYRGIFEPANVINSSFASHISQHRNLTLKSQDLLEKYGKQRQMPLKPNKHVVVANDGGLFSILNRYVSILAHELERDPSSIIIPDWRIEALIESLGTSTFNSFCYGTEADGNIFLKIFNPPFDIPIELYNDEKYLRNDAYLRTDYNAKLEPNLTYIYAYKLYHDADFQQWREMYHRHFSKHISLNRELDDEIKSFVKDNFDGHFVISAHVRHPSHSMEQPGGRLPTVEIFRKHIEHELKLAKESQDKPVKLFIATDQESVIEYFNKYYSDILVTTHATRTSKKHDEIYENTDPKNKQKEGFQIQHIMAANASNWSVKMAREVVTDAWLLSHSQVLIHITSNIATAVSYINPEVKMIYCN